MRLIAMENFDFDDTLGKPRPREPTQFTPVNDFHLWSHVVHQTGYMRGSSPNKKRDT
jgi:hypothetical protein